MLDIDLLELAITTWKGKDTGKLVSLVHFIVLFVYFLFGCFFLIIIIGLFLMRLWCVLFFLSLA